MDGWQRSFTFSFHFFNNNKEHKHTQVTKNILRNTVISFFAKLDEKIDITLMPVLSMVGRINLKM